jgi:hypothetical protein
MQRMWRRLLFTVLVTSGAARAETALNTDVLVYAATPGGIASAIVAREQGRRVLLIEPSQRVGGMMSGGLVATDLGAEDAVGGFTKRFFERIQTYYSGTEYAARTAGPLPEGGPFFEPRVALELFNEKLREAKVDTRLGWRAIAAERQASRITRVRFVNGSGGTLAIDAKVFIDASYEGDLMDLAEAPFRLGREAREEYDEFFAGLEAGPDQYRGKGDHRLQAFNLRSTLTNRDELRAPIPKPDQYTVPEGPIQAVLRRNLKTIEALYPNIPHWGGVGGKYDPNVQDWIDGNHAWADASPAERERIYRGARDFWLSLWWGLQNDPRLPAEFRASAKRWGLPNDEYLDSGHITPQIYVRVARRLLGRYLMTERDVTTRRFKPDSIAIGSYNLDSHTVTRVLEDGGLREDGYFIQGTLPYEIPYRAITPDEPVNLLVPVALSATHVAYGTIRMEPVFMTLGHAAGMAAHLAIGQHNAIVKNVDIAALQSRLETDGVRFRAPYGRPSVESALDWREPLVAGREVTLRGLAFAGADAPIAEWFWSLDGSGEIHAKTQDVSVQFNSSKTHRVMLIGRDTLGRDTYLYERDIRVGEQPLLDFEQLSHAPQRQGNWERIPTPADQIGLLMFTTLRATGTEPAQAEFIPRLERAGRYRIALAYPRLPDGAKNATVTINTSGGKEEIALNQTLDARNPLPYLPIGEFDCAAGNVCKVTVTHAADSDGTTYVSRVKWIWAQDALTLSTDVASGAPQPRAATTAGHGRCVIGFCW